MSQQQVNTTATPALPPISYRIKTFGQFRQAMLTYLNESPVATAIDGNAADYQIALVELWAYVADILAFYQERVANEAFLPTAVEQDTLSRLAGLVGYAASPGVGAQALLTFTVDGDTVKIPSGFRVAGSGAAGGQSIQFATTDGLLAHSVHNAIPVSSTAPVDQYQHPLVDGVRTIVLTGTALGLHVGDYVLVVDASNSSYPWRLATVIEDATSSTTTVTWVEDRNVEYESPARLYAFLTAASTFGANAPNWYGLSAALQAAYPSNWELPVDADYYLPAPDALPNEIPLNTIYTSIGLPNNDQAWILLLTGPQNGSPGIPTVTPIQLVDISTANVTSYTLSGQVTTLSLVSPIPGSTYPMRTTTVLAGSRQLTLQNNLPRSKALSGDVIVLDGLYPDLADKQIAILKAHPSNAADSDFAYEAVQLLGAPELLGGEQITIVSLESPLAGAYAFQDATLLANAVWSTEGTTVSGEILGSGTGGARQSFDLHQTPLTYLVSDNVSTRAVTSSTLTVFVDGVEWAEAPSLADSVASDRQYTVSTDLTGQATVLFGDGVHGAQPPVGVNNVTANYRIGSGTSGNLPSGSISQLVDSLTGVQSVANPMPALGGLDPETAPQIQTNAPIAARTFGRAVSLEDYTLITRTFPGVAKARAEWVRDGVSNAVRITVAVVDGVPLAQSAGFIDNLRAFLAARSNPNIPLRLVDYDAVPIDLTVTITVDPRFDALTTLVNVRAVLNPGTNPDGTLGYFAFDSLDFGQNIYASVIYALVQGVPGVSSATIDVFHTVDKLLTPSPFQREDWGEVSGLRTQVMHLIKPSPQSTIAIGPNQIATIGIDPAKPDVGVLTIKVAGG